MMTFIRRGIAVAAAAVALVGFGQTSASASVQFEPDYWNPLCPLDICDGDGGSTGMITWGQRTAEVSGEVYDHHYYGWTTVHFDAFAGSTKIDSTTRSVTDGIRPFGFTMGDPNLVGGINRIRVQVCWWVSGGSLPSCSQQWNLIRN